MPQTTTCKVSGENFEVSDLEIALRKKLDLIDKDGSTILPDKKPQYYFRELGAFWQHWNLYKRKCDKTGKDIISVFRPDCDYPVWHRDEWIKHANPPGASPDFTRPIFPQMWEFFQKSPLPHITGSGNENCEYTDDAWFSKNCYLAHSLAHSEDLTYCYRLLHSKDSYYCVFSDKLELCYDVINSNSCFQMVHSFNCRNCRDSAFLYDCRNCSDCMFSFNLRNKQYCFANKQLSKEEYFAKKAEWDLSSHKAYEKAKEFFRKMFNDMAWHRALSNDNCENTIGNYNDNCKDSVDCYFCQENEECVNCFRNFIGKSSLYFHGLGSELCYYSILAQEKCYEIRYCSQIVNSQYLQYCAFCLNCQNCFGCCGLVGKKFHIFNKPYSEEEYHSTVARIIEHMKSTGEYNKFFPGYFAQSPYDESWSSFYFPLTKEEQIKASFKYKDPIEKKKPEYLETGDIPDKPEDVTALDKQNTYWDEVSERPLRIREDDLKFAKRLSVPLSGKFYIRHLQDNLRLLPFDGQLRDTTCGKCQKEVKTSWPAELDGRILCEEGYLSALN